VRSVGPVTERPRVLAEIGRGGMATVHLAWVPGVDGCVVVKRMKTDLARDARSQRMFLEEARLAAALCHPNIVATIDVRTDGQAPEIVMEYLEGASLHALLARTGQRGAFTFPMHVRVLVDVLAGLQHAHDATHRIIHRDVSPQNVIVTTRGVAKLVDFGIAKAADSPLDTTTGIVKGKVSYMSPEQAAGVGVDPRSDLFAVGVMLWEAISGRRLYDEAPSVAILSRLLSRRPPPLPGAADRGLPPLAEAIAMRALAWDPAERWSSATELRAALQELLRELGGAPSDDEIGAVVRRAFAADHAKLRAVVDRARTDPGGSSAALANADPSDDVTAQLDTRATAPSLTLTSSDRTLPSPAGRPMRLSTGRALTIAASLGGAVLFVGFASKPTSSAVVAPTSATAVSSPSPEIPRPTPAAVSSSEERGTDAREVMVRATPSTARLFLDGAPLPTNPYVLRSHRRGVISIIRAEAPGHRSEERRVDLGQADGGVELALVRVARTAPPPVAGATSTAPASTTAPSSALPPTARKPRLSIDKELPW
jgi:serine/threonine-protein kinase